MTVPPDYLDQIQALQARIRALEGQLQQFQALERFVTEGGIFAVTPRPDGSVHIVRAAAVAPAAPPAAAGTLGMAGVTVVVTSCGRQDLLQRTLDSFLAANTHPVESYVVVEDSAIPGINDALKQRYRALPFTWIDLPQNVGQVRAIDIAYGQVATDYIFHCEDDWAFEGGGFIEASKAVLEARPDILQVWLRAEGDTSGHPVEPALLHAGAVAYRLMAMNHGGMWHGFSWNPGLRRLRDYRLVAPFGQHAEFDPARPVRSEQSIGIIYKNLGFRAAILTRGHCRHIGGERHVGGEAAALTPAAAGRPA